MIKNSLIVVCTLSFALGLPSAARGCMCGMTTAEVSFVKAHVVFTGKVVRIAPVKKASVGLLMKEAGTLHLLKVPRWETFVDKARIVTLEISEGLKGTSGKTVEVLTAVYDGGATCGVNFRTGESYLVYAKRNPSLSADEAKLPKQEWTKEIRLKAEADKFNGRLPTLETNICARTMHMRWAKEDLNVIRLIIKNEVPKQEVQEQPKPRQIIYRRCPTKPCS